MRNQFELLLFFLLITTIVSKAEKHTWTIGTGGDFSDITSSMEDSRVQDGDELHILEGTYIRYVYNNPQIVSKAVTVIGNGYEKTANGFVSQLALECDGATVKQLYLSTIFIRANNVRVERCRASQIDGSENYKNNNALIHGCIVNWGIKGRSTGDQTGWILRGNLLVNTNYLGSNLQALSNARIDHNLIVGYDTTYGDLYLVKDVFNSEFTNNIIQKEYFSLDFSSNCISTAKKFEYNIISSTADSWSTNKSNFTLGDICVCNGKNTEQEYYKLSAQSIASGYANDGGDCGPWSGSFPYSINGLAPTEAYAVLSSDKATLSFFYDDMKYIREGTLYNKDNFREYLLDSWGEYKELITKVIIDNTFAKYDGIKSTHSWFCEFKNLTEIVGLQNLNTSNVTNMSSMFRECVSLTDLDLNSFDTSSVTDMEGMFWGCSSLTYLDLSSFNTKNVTKMSKLYYAHFWTATAGIFQECRSLRTIFIGNSWSTESLEENSCMFLNCTNLVGGDGTVYDENYTDKTRAYAGKDGYLTLKRNNGIQHYLNSLTDVEDTYVDGVYQRQFLNSDWQTIYVPFTISYNDWADRFELAEVKSCANYDDDSDGKSDRRMLVADIINAGVLKANYPYLIRAKSITGDKLTVNVSEVTDMSLTPVYFNDASPTAILKGTYTAMTGLKSAGQYRLMGNHFAIPSKDEEVLPPYRWYLVFEGFDSGDDLLFAVRVMSKDETTKILNLRTDVDNNRAEKRVVYDLSGRQVEIGHDVPFSTLPKGVYIFNKKKYVVK